MQTTIILDDDLVREAQRVTGLQEQAAVIHAGLRALIGSDKARRVTCVRVDEPQSRVLRHPGSARGLLKILAEDDGHLRDFEEYTG